MSRIDEALKRAAGVPLTSRTHPKPFALDDYVGERAVEPVTPAEEPAPVHAVESSARLSAVHAVETAPPPIHTAEPEVEQEQDRAEPEPETPAPTSNGPLRFKLPGDPDAASGAASASLRRYRRVANAIQSARQQRGLKTVMITSALEDEEKVRAAIDLARVMSETQGLRVLLIDADLRHPSVHRLVGARNESGLSEALNSDQHQFPLFQVTPLFHILPAGQTGARLAPEWGSDRMRRLLDECVSLYDLVLLNGPAMSSPMKPAMLARLTNGVVFIVGASAPFSRVEKAIADLGDDCIIGTVLNGLRELDDLTAID
jgi:Mrp family chromosome partitioning ATPase